MRDSLKNKTTNRINTMNELYKIISSSCHFRKWVRCQVAVKVENNTWLYGDNELVEINRLVKDYLEDTRTFRQWVAIGMRSRGIAI